MHLLAVAARSLLFDQLINSSVALPSLCDNGDIGKSVSSAGRRTAAGWGPGGARGESCGAAGARRGAASPPGGACS